MGFSYNTWGASWASFWGGSWGVSETDAGGLPYIYSPPQRQKAEENQREKIRKEKTDLERLESVLAYNQRQADIAAESKKLANLLNQTRLAKLENEYLMEVNRLLEVKADLIRRIRKSEDALIMMMVLKRRRLRAVNSQVFATLAIN